MKTWAKINWFKAYKLKKLFNKLSNFIQIIVFSRFHGNFLNV